MEADTVVLFTGWIRVTGSDDTSYDNRVNLYLDNQPFSNANLDVYPGQGWVQFSAQSTFPDGSHSFYLQTLSFGGPVGLELSYDDFSLTVVCSDSAT